LLIIYINSGAKSAEQTKSPEQKNDPTPMGPTPEIDQNNDISHKNNMEILHHKVSHSHGLTKQATDACWLAGVKVSSIDPCVLQNMRDVADQTASATPRHLVRALYDTFKEQRGCQQYLAVLFQTSRSKISKIVNDPDLGSRPMGRPPSMTRVEEDEVIRYVREEQIAGRCHKVSDIADWINKNLLLDGRIISERLVLHNRYIMGKLNTKCPQKVDQDRIAASVYTNFINFFAELQALMDQHSFQPDLILNMDETKISAGATKNAAEVLYDEELGMPVSSHEPLEDHITFSCGVSASGMRLLPVFIVKNKSVNCEKILRGANFQYGDFGMQHSTKGWQDAV
jgi:hypothetical protein